MANSFVKITKISNASGRSDYISDPTRQEEIVLHKSEMKYSWKVHSEFEKDNKKSRDKNNEARELIVALPNELYKTTELEKICDDLTNEIIPENHDYEYAVHWNHRRTHLHLHLLFSERENQLELTPKVYKRDMWYDKNTNKMAKANADGAELRYKKGQVQKDKDGNIKFQSDIFKAKNTVFKNKNFLLNTVHEKTIKTFEKYGFNLDMPTNKNSPYLSQKSLYKGASKDYLKKAAAWNKQVQIYNKNIKEHMELEPIQRENYLQIKKEIKANVKEVNAESKKITDKSINLVADMARWTSTTLSKLKQYLNRKTKEMEILGEWENLKDKFEDLYYENDKKEKEIDILKENIGQLNELDEDLEEMLVEQKELLQVAQKRGTRKEIEIKPEKENFSFYRDDEWEI